MNLAQAKRIAGRAADECQAGNYRYATQLVIYRRKTKPVEVALIAALSAAALVDRKDVEAAAKFTETLASLLAV